MKSGPRLTIPKQETLCVAQRAVYDTVASGPRGVVRGPILLWLHSPELASRAQHTGEFLRWGTVFDARLSELAILITARHYTCHYVWFNHSSVALEKGVRQEVLEAIKHNRKPDFEREDEAALYNFVAEMLRSHTVSDATVERAKALFGERGVVELGGIVGFYHMGIIVLETAKMPLPDGSLTCLPQ